MWTTYLLSTTILPRWQLGFGWGARQRLTTNDTTLNSFRFGNLCRLMRSMKGKYQSGRRVLKLRNSHFRSNKSNNESLCWPNVQDVHKAVKMDTNPFLMRLIFSLSDLQIRFRWNSVQNSLPQARRGRHAQVNRQTIPYLAGEFICRKRVFGGEMEGRKKGCVSHKNESTCLSLNTPTCMMSDSLWNFLKYQKEIPCARENANVVDFWSSEISILVRNLFSESTKDIWQNSRKSMSVI